MSQEKATLALTADDLKEIIQTAIEAAKAPNVLEQRKLDAEMKAVESAQQDRSDQSDQIKAAIQAKRSTQRICSHMHRDGGSHCVYILDGNYILCQKEQCKIRPGVAPANYKGGDIYSTELFNKLFQTVATNEMFG